MQGSCGWLRSPPSHDIFHKQVLEEIQYDSCPDGHTKCQELLLVWESFQDDVTSLQIILTREKPVWVSHACPILCVALEAGAHQVAEKK